MVDPIQYSQWFSEPRQRCTLLPSVVESSSPLMVCSCERCERLIYRFAAKPRFAGYTHINPLVDDQLSEHQLFLCDDRVEAFLFKQRSWRKWNERILQSELNSDIVASRTTTRLWISGDFFRQVAFRAPRNEREH